MAHHNDLGKWGEKVAHDLLVAKGYGIVTTNWKMNSLEVDIIATKGTRIVFVEVKTRSTSFVDPEKAVDRRRINHLVRSANAYILTNNCPLEVQFDIITIIGRIDDPNPIVHHIPDAFLAPIRTIR